jgi:hypothetical protein
VTLNVGSSGPQRLQARVPWLWLELVPVQHRVLGWNFPWLGLVQAHQDPDLGPQIQQGPRLSYSLARRGWMPHLATRVGPRQFRVSLKARLLRHRIAQGAEAAV